MGSTVTHHSSSSVAEKVDDTGIGAISQAESGSAAVAAAGAALPLVLIPSPADTEVCFYHGNCLDGALGAVIIELASRRECATIPSWFNMRPEDYDVVGKAVVCVDITPPQDTLAYFLKVAKSVMVLDHHKTALDAIQGARLPDCCLRFSVHECGASLAWQWAFSELAPPALLCFIKAQDLFDWRELERTVPRARSISRAIEALTAPTVAELRAALNGGSAFLSYVTSAARSVDVVIELQLDRIMSSMVRRTILPRLAACSLTATTQPAAAMAVTLAQRLTGSFPQRLVTAAVINCQTNVSNVSERVYTRMPDVDVVWQWYCKTPDKVRVMLRSHGRFDCEAFARQWPGGGGHPNSASFAAPSVAAMFEMFMPTHSPGGLHHAHATSGVLPADDPPCGPSTVHTSHADGRAVHSASTGCAGAANQNSCCAGTRCTAGIGRASLDENVEEAAAALAVTTNKAEVGGSGHAFFMAGCAKNMSPVITDARDYDSLCSDASCSDDGDVAAAADVPLMFTHSRASSASCSVKSDAAVHSGECERRKKFVSDTAADDTASAGLEDSPCTAPHSPLPLRLQVSPSKFSGAAAQASASLGAARLLRSALQPAHASVAACAATTGTASALGAAASVTTAAATELTAATQPGRPPPIACPKKQYAPSGGNTEACRGKHCPATNCMIVGAEANSASPIVVAGQSSSPPWRKGGGDKYGGGASKRKGDASSDRIDCARTPTHVVVTTSRVIGTAVGAGAERVGAGGGRRKITAAASNSLGAGASRARLGSVHRS